MCPALNYMPRKSRQGGLMINALISGLSGLGSNPDREHSVVLLSKTLYSHNASLHPDVSTGTRELSVGGNPAVD